MEELILEKRLRGYSNYRYYASKNHYGMKVLVIKDLSVNPDKSFITSANIDEKDAIFEWYKLTTINILFADKEYTGNKSEDLKSE